MGKEKEGPKQLVATFAETTSMHGVSRINRKPGIIRSTFWVLAVLGGAGVAGYGIWKVGVAYSLREVSTVVSLEYNSKLDFPAVTICNLNPLRLSSFETHAELENLGNKLGLKRNSTRLPLSTAAPKEDEDEDYEDYTVFLEQAALIPPRDKMEMGHDLRRMLQSCSFHGKPCTVRNFTQFLNFRYGNCFTFEADASPFKQVTKSGPMYGLTLKLFVEEDEYVSDLADSVGFKVVVHTSSHMPFPEDEGFEVATGFSTSVAVTQVVIERASEPYGNCVNYPSLEEMPENIFSTPEENIEYSDKACMLTCYQTQLMTECNCCDARYPCLETEFQVCDMYADEKNCPKHILFEFENDLSGCVESCLPKCSDTAHQLEISSSRWPTNNGVEDVVGAMFEKVGIDTLPVDDDSSHREQKDFLRENVARIQVFFKQLNYEKIETRPAYDWSRLLSDVGGQAGLWLGFSLLTLGEVLELILDTLISCFKKCCSGRQHISPVH